MLVMTECRACGGSDSVSCDDCGLRLHGDRRCSRDGHAFEPRHVVVLRDWSAVEFGPRKKVRR